jgi:hypothetical protein
MSERVLTRPPVGVPIGSVGRWLACLSVASALALLTADWIPGAATVVLCAIWTWLRTDDGPPVLAMALSFQWLQVVVGVLYFHATGRRVVEMDRIDYQPMVALGLACVAALTVGLASGLALLRARPAAAAPGRSIATRVLVIGYLVTTAVNGAATAVAFSVPALTQVIFAFTFVRLALLFLLVQRLLHPRPRWALLSLVIAGEIVVGFTGFFADFREALVIITLAVLDGFRGRPGRWAALVMVVAATLVAGVAWTGIKVEYRRSYRQDAGFADSREARLDRLQSLTSDWIDHAPERIGPDFDKLVSRVWAVYYPGLAVRRVPAVMPHENGRILLEALTHIVTPRILFPDKKGLDSDSEMVRKYSGEWVASREQGTSIAFGYAGESYIDFGFPGMLAPVFAWGLLMGLAYRGLRRLVVHREIAVATCCTIFWLAVSLFERSWIKTIGMGLTVLLVLGSAAVALDRMLARKAAPPTGMG